MNPQQSEFSHFYEDQVSAQRLRDHIWGRWNEPSVLVSVAALVIAIVFKVYGSDGAPQDPVSLVASFLWDCIIFAVPAPVLFALDGRINSSVPRRPRADDARRSVHAQSTHATKREAMSRLMGLDRPGGVLASMSQARTRALSVTGSVLGLKVDLQRPPGLGNRDNSCYQNSILQGLAALPSFSDYLAACVRAVDSHNHGSDVAQTLGALLWDLNNPCNNGKTIWTPTLLKSMSTWTQQDAQEYFSKMLDDIDKGVAEAIKERRRFPGLEADCGPAEAAGSDQDMSPSPNLSAMAPLRNPLEGLLAQRVACVECGHAEGLSLIPFNCLTLSLGLDKNRHDLFERLDAYSRVESIEGVECPKCTLLKAQRLLTKLVAKLEDSGAAPQQLAEPRRRLGAVERALEEDDFDERTLAEDCKISSQGKVSSTKTKQIVIARPPQSLAMHVNRSVFDPWTCDMIKNSAPVSFPLTLDLGPWCLGSSASRGPAAQAGAARGEEQWQLGATASMVAGDLRPLRLTGPMYELRAAVTHAGRHDNGHYICYRTYPEQGADGGEEAAEGGDEEETKARRGGWWRLSDHHVSRVDAETVAGLSPGVFMLFYECVDAAMTAQGEDGAAEDGERSEAEGGGAETVALPASDDAEGL